MSQRPILPNQTHVYNFTADPVGTHLWHGHLLATSADGLFGARKGRDAEGWKLWIQIGVAHTSLCCLEHLLSSAAADSLLRRNDRRATEGRRGGGVSGRIAAGRLRCRSPAASVTPASSRTGRRSRRRFGTSDSGRIPTADLISRGGPLLRFAARSGSSGGGLGFCLVPVFTVRSLFAHRLVRGHVRGPPLRPRADIPRGL